MTILATIYSELLGLFVDDGSLALSILGTVLLAGILAFGFAAPSLLVGLVLVIGCFAALIVSTLRAGKS